VVVVVVTAAAVVEDTGEAVEAAVMEVGVAVMEVAEMTATGSVKTDTKTTRHRLMSPPQNAYKLKTPTSNSLHHTPRFLLLPNLVIIIQFVCANSQNLQPSLHFDVLN
jgi:hypothetical protein